MKLKDIELMPDDRVKEIYKSLCEHSDKWQQDFGDYNNSTLQAMSYVRKILNKRKIKVRHNDS